MGYCQRGGIRTDHSVNTHAPATRRRQSVLQGSAERLVDHLGLVIALCLLAGLLLKSQTLLGGNVQLGVTCTR